MKKALVTGGSRGIGLQIVRRLLARGCAVVVLARSNQTIPKDILEKVEFVSFDLNQVSDIGEVVDNIGNVDILINNAAILNSLPFDEYDPLLRDRLININIAAPVELITTYSKFMIKNGGGRIINISSIAGIIGQSDIWYAISKAAIINATKSFSKLIGPHGITINAIAPGPVATEMFSLIPPDRQKKVLDRTISGTPASINDIARVVEWLSLDAPSHLNGICIDMTNGATLR